MMNKMERLICASVFISTILLSCAKDDARVPPDVSIVPGVLVQDTFMKQVSILFEDELTGKPLPGLRVQLYQGTRSFDHLTNEDGIVRFNQIDTRMPLWLPRPYFGIDSPYFMPNVLFVFPSFGAAMLPPNSFQYRMEFRPVFEGKDSIGFRVDVPRRAKLEINVIQDSLYLEKRIQNSRFRLYYSLSVSDSANYDPGWVDGNFIDLPTDSSLLRSARGIYLPASRRFRMNWQLIEEQIVSYFYDDGEYRTIREGEMMLDTLRYNRVNSIDLHF